MINGKISNLINNIRINKEDKSLSVSLAIDDVPATRFFNNQLLSQVHEGNTVAWLQAIYERREVEVTFQPNSTDYIELAEHLAAGVLKYTLPQARIICNWIQDNIRQPEDDIDWAMVFLEIIDHAE